MNLLLVDDEFDVLNGILNAVNFDVIGVDTVYTSQDAGHAKELLSRCEVDVMVTDIEMPGESGLELMQWVRERRLEIVMLFCTVYADFNYAQKAVELHSFDYFLERLHEIFGTLQYGEQPRKRPCLRRQKGNCFPTGRKIVFPFVSWHCGKRRNCLHGSGMPFKIWQKRFLGNKKTSIWRLYFAVQTMSGAWYCLSRRDSQNSVSRNFAGRCAAVYSVISPLCSVVTMIALFPWMGSDRRHQSFCCFVKMMRRLRAASIARENTASENLAASSRS